MRLWSLAALIALAALALAALGPASAQQPAPEGVELRLSLVDENDGVVPPGSTISVAGELRMQPWDGELSVSAGSVWLYDPHIWEESGRPRLPLADQALIRAQQQSDDFTGVLSSNPLPAGSSLRLLAYDGDTIAARAFDTSNAPHPFNLVYVFEASTGEQVGSIDVPRRLGSQQRVCAYKDGNNNCSTSSDGPWGWGRANEDNTASAVAVWQENDNTAWLFLGWHRADRENAGGNFFGDMGALLIYEINHSADTITLRRTVYVSSYNEMFSKAHPSPSASQDDQMHYGGAVAVSADGSTLAVGARRAHDVGAVYVYTRPTGGWGALSWNSGVRVSPVVIPPWGDAANERPFEPQSSTDGPGGTECDAYCRSVSSFMGDVDDSNTDGHALFGYYLALSADGSVLAVSAPEKRFSSTRAAGSGQFRGGRTRPQHGEVFVFTAPTGGWSTVPNYKTETDPDRTEITYSADASSFDPALHYNTGPDKRVNAPTWSFSFDWSNNQEYRLGERLALSPDGTTLAASDRINDAVNIFQVDSPSGWASGPTAPTAQITGVDDGGRWGGFGFSRDNLTFALGDPTWTTNQGRLLFFNRPADGTWDSATAADAEEQLAPTATFRRAQERYGRALAWNLNGGSLAVSATEGPQSRANNVGPGRIWTLSAPLTCPITERTDEEGETTRTAACAVNLGDTRIVIPQGTPDGTFTIAGTVTLTYGEGLTLERSAQLEVEVGTVQEVDDVTLDFAVDNRGTPTDVRDDRPHRSTLSARGDSTVLRLQILNERDKPAAVGSVASVVAITTAGSLSTTLGDGCKGASGGGGGNACEIDVSALTISNTANIPLTLTHGGTGGTAEVEVLVVAKKDGARYEPEPVRVTLAGAATSLSVEEATGALLNVGTSDSRETSRDDRDVLELTVTARDALGNQVPVPTRGASWRITGPDGRSVAASKIAVQWPLSSANCATGGTANPPLPLPSLLVQLLQATSDTTASAFSAENRGNPLCVSQGRRLLAYDAQSDDFTIAANTAVFVVEGSLTRELEVGDLRSKARLNVNAEASQPLAAGEYTLELRAGTLTATAGFRVSGGAAALALGEPDGRLAAGERISITAAVSDEEGNAVSDGTPVEWSATDVGTRTVLVQISADETTTAGAATATWQVIGPGVSTVRAVAGNAANVRLVEVPVPAVAPPPPPPPPVEGLSSRLPNRLSAWNGQGMTTASELLAALDGVSSLLLWTPSGWLRYAQQDGAIVPGSLNFEVLPGSVLWLAE